VAATPCQLLNMACLASICVSHRLSNIVQLSPCAGGSMSISVNPLFDPIVSMC
jgi:hypothetical protein